MDNIADIFYKYNDVIELIKDNFDSIDDIMTDFCTFLITKQPEFTETEVNNYVEFMIMVPISSCKIFVKFCDKIDKRDESFKYITKLHYEAMKNEKYRIGLYDRILVEQKKSGGFNYNGRI